MDKRTGLFTKLEYAGIDRIKRPMEVNIWRAPIDNDLPFKAEWYRAGYNRTTVRAYGAEAAREGDVVRIHCPMALLADTEQRIMDLDTIWTISKSGEITLSMSVKRHPQFPVLPRFGIRLFLDESMDHVRYYGMGPMESYIDKHRASSHGLYAAKVKDLHEDYTRPQENGSHYDCSYVVTEGEYGSLAACSETGFSFNASVYTQEELMSKKHNYELIPSGSTVLCLDYGQNGIGSGSCVTALSEQYRLEPKEFEFHIKLIFDSHILPDDPKGKVVYNC